MSESESLLSTCCTRSTCPTSVSISQKFTGPRPGIVGNPRLIPIRFSLSESAVGYRRWDQGAPGIYWS